MKVTLAAPWAVMKKWWCVHVAGAFAMLLAVVPALAHEWPTLAPVLLDLFPSGGKQWVPIVGIGLVIAARSIKQPALTERNDG
ncbi:DUF7940 domain-containing protein [Chitinasiproducens palmae]|uniref:Holin n=1 Tax=Chitinasiproducens palmae TaxID=1770053 RepID=A0A1H2PT22_9BURK|nr:hypothetical protein [Chitinasiproducens palmae]SDV50221.1 hypothetical protein SAMN05216551_1112 [Chitinasiproducens palmae]